MSNNCAQVLSGDKKEKQTQIVKDEFQGLCLILPMFVCSTIILYTFARNSTQGWRHFGANIRGNHHLGREAGDVHFIQVTSFGFLVLQFIKWVDPIQKKNLAYFLGRLEVLGNKSSLYNNGNFSILENNDPVS